MRWPWQKRASGDLLVCSWEAQTLAYVQAKQQDGAWTVSRMGVEQQGSDTLPGFLQRLKDLGLKGMQVVVMLRADQYQFLQIDTPKVPPEELRAAARYQVREMLKAHVDDVTIDLVDVGDGKHHQGSGHSFVVAALNSVVREATDMALAMDWQMSIIDVQEMAQRNLQSMLAKQGDSTDRANAALVLVPGQQALLTICANEELFYTRRFDVPEGFLAGVWGQGVTVSAPVDGFTPVEEYVPSYGAGDLSLGEDFSVASTSLSVKNNAPHVEEDQAQRLLVEVQRSLDVWDRTWSSLPLSGLRVYAGERSAELAQWLTQQLGQKVVPLEVGALFAGFDVVPSDHQSVCLPLLGVFLRMEGITS
jgi:MSHA biogenesis protein MshI